MTCSLLIIHCKHLSCNAPPHDPRQNFFSFCLLFLIISTKKDKSWIDIPRRWLLFFFAFLSRFAVFDRNFFELNVGCRFGIKGVVSQCTMNSNQEDVSILAPTVYEKSSLKWCEDPSKDCYSEYFCSCL